MRSLLVSAVLSVSSLMAASPGFDRALNLYNHTDYEDSLKVLLPLQQQKDGEVLQLIGQNYFMLGDARRAGDFFQKAVAVDGSRSSYYHWLGRAFGRRAEMSNPFTAISYATKARQNFEKAVQLDATNSEALNDLFEFYLQAPGILGGGHDKAAAVAEQIAKMDPIEGHWARARIAEKKKEFGSAEQQLRRAAELAPRQVGRIIDLAKFLAKQGRFQESEQTFVAAEQIAPDSPKLLFARADTYIQTGRNIETARELLKRYLNAKLTPEDPPRSEAEKLLKQLSNRS